MTPFTSRRWALASILFCFFAIDAFATNVPINLATNPTSSSSITLTWTDNSTDEIGFTFRFDTSSSFTSPSYVWTGGPNVTSYVHSGRTAATTYYYQIKAEGATDPQDSAFSGTVAGTTRPTNLAASPVSSSQINLSWNGNASNSSITGYTVAMNTSASFTGASYQFVSGAGATSVSKTSLTSGTTYYFAIKAEGTADAHDSPFTSWVSATTTASATPISTYFYGVNAWMPHQIGSRIYYGDLDEQWGNISAAGTKIMRYGGHGVDENSGPEWASQYLDLVDEMQSRGIEPVLQVPVFGTANTAADAADIVEYVNITYGRGVKYWSIGNEPELDGYDYTSASQVAPYIKSFASAMKAVDPTIKIIGPDLAWYNDAILDDLTTPGGTHDITGKDANNRWYVDIISFHHYTGDGTQSRSTVVSSLMSSGGFNDDLAALKARLANCNSYHSRSGTSALKMAVTEANVNYSNTTTDSLTGAGAKSFVGGQFWAELMGIAQKQGVDFVTFWSVIEGSTSSGNELGFIGADGTTKRPSYYHFEMLAENFRGDVAGTTDTQSLVKTFASKASDQVAVLLMNQDQTNSFNYTVRLNTGTVSGSNPLKVNVDAGLAVESSGTIATESTILLVFNSSGTLTKKIEYKLYGHANSNLPPTVTNY
ncbi:MAG TPA: fibronectin type III domain-containing protein [Thermoanaerobaculia bacterium]|nr:fibronectin type III domain-containing protein [Thermoanaerobaculia bacterium]